MHREIARLAAARRAQRDVVCRRDSQLDREVHRQAFALDEIAHAEQRLAELGARYGVLHLDEAHEPPAAQHAVAHVDDLGLADSAGDEVHELRDRTGAPAPERGRGAEREVGEQDVVAPRLPRRLGTEWLVGPVGDLDGGDVGVREPVTVDVLVVVDDVVEVVDERVERPRLLDRVQTERRLALERHFRHHAEGAEADACAHEHLGLFVSRAAQHFAVGRDQLEPGHERGQAAEALPTAVGGRRDRARDRLPVDITQVGQRQVTRLQLVVELP